MLGLRIAVACVAVASMGLAVGEFSAGAAARHCTSSHLRAEFDGLSAASGRVYRDVRLANHGPLCTLRGWPAVSFLGVSGATLSLKAPSRMRESVWTVTLSEGGHAYFTFTYINEGFCSPRVTVSAVRITPPGDRHPLVLHRTFSVCTPNPGAVVYPIRSTRSITAPPTKIPPIISPKADPYYRYGGLKGTEGFGRVKPRTIYYGGDPTGLVCRIHWHSWGGRVARGSGVGWYVSGNQSVGQGHSAKASVVASKLGKWRGRPAYNRLKWSFPNHGRDRTSFCA